MKQRFIAILLLLLALPATAADCDAPDIAARVLEVEVAPSPQLVVCMQRPLRTELPDTLFGFNIHHYHFERELFDPATGKAPDAVLTSLRALPGALYRYPGGLIANRFSWEDAVGPAAGRAERKSVKWDFPAPVLFGVDEYLAMVESVDGVPWYVLNLVGWDQTRMFRELDSAAIAASNARLAGYMLERRSDAGPRYYQLGNELDRAAYQWSHEKYIERSAATIAAMREVDPEARFVAFLREFDWTYRGAEAERGISRYQDFIRDVLTGLPEVDDFSLHFYYDARGSDQKTRRLPWRLRQFRRAIDTAIDVRDGKAPGVWITEHSRGIDFGQVKARDMRPYTSNLAAAISTGDFLIALTQIPEIRGAARHAMNSDPWQTFDPDNGLQPTTPYWAMRVLRQTAQPRVLATYSQSPNGSGFEDGYDVRGMVSVNDEGNRLGIWAINRVPRAAPLEVFIPELAGRRVELFHYSVAGRQGEDPDQAEYQPLVQLGPEGEAAAFDAEGHLQLRLPPASVSGFDVILK